MPFAENAGTRLHYETWGTGEPVLLIMGLGGTKDYWYPQVDALAARFKVLALDNRGVGQSDKPRDAWKMADMAADAVAVLDAEGHGSAHVVGVSMGGMIAQHVALGHPERVRRLVLCATTPGMYHAPAAPEIIALMTQTQGKTPEQIARDNLRLMFTPETIAAEKDLMETVVEMGLRLAPPRRGFMNQTMAVVGHDTRKRLPEISHETLVITGDKDELVPPKNSEILAAEIPGARLEVLKDTAHGFLMDRAEDSNRILLEFLGA